MASVQCYEPVEQACEEGHKPHAEHGVAAVHVHTISLTVGHDKAENQRKDHGLSNTASCQRKKRGEHKRMGLLQKIKDRISGNSSDSGSSSDSESDNEKCEKRQN